MGLRDRSVQVCPGEQRAQQTPGTMYASTLAGRAGPAGRSRLLAPARLKVILSPACLISDLSGLCPPGQLPKRPREGPGSSENGRLPGGAAALWEVNSGWRPRPRGDRPPPPPRTPTLPTRTHCSPKPGLGVGTSFQRFSFLSEPRKRPPGRGGGWGWGGDGMAGDRLSQAGHSAESPDPAGPLRGAGALSSRAHFVSRAARAPRRPFMFLLIISYTSFCL